MHRFEVLQQAVPPPLHLPRQRRHRVRHVREGLQRGGVRVVHNREEGHPPRHAGGISALHRLHGANRELRHEPDNPGRRPVLDVAPGRVRRGDRCDTILPRPGVRRGRRREPVRLRADGPRMGGRRRGAPQDPGAYGGQGRLRSRLHALEGVSSELRQGRSERDGPSGVLPPHRALSGREVRHPQPQAVRGRARGISGHEVIRQGGLRASWAWTRRLPWPSSTRTPGPFTRC